MRLSIGVPAYNQGSFLRETLDSLIHQDVSFYEIVVSNNHSTDNTPGVLAAFARDYPGRIRMVTPPQHLPAAAHWNFTVSRLAGDWVSLMSSDDLALPNFVRSVTSATTLSPNALLVRGAWRNIDSAGTTLEERHLISVAAVTRPPKTIYEQRLGPKGSFAAFALRRDIWQKTGGFPEDLRLIADWGMWLLAGAFGDFIYTDDVIASYRVGHQQPAHQQRHHIYLSEVFRLYDQVLPRATTLAGLGRPAWIARASRTTFREMLAACSRDFAPPDRGLLVDAFRPWAESLGETARLTRFAAGDRVRDFNPALPARMFARRLVAALRRTPRESH